MPEARVPLEPAQPLAPGTGPVQWGCHLHRLAVNPLGGLNHANVVPGEIVVEISEA